LRNETNTKPASARIVTAPSNEKIGSLADRLLLYCYHYDPQQGNYGFVAMRAVRIGGAVTIVALVGFVFVSLRREGHR
jgi:protein SCO1/2